MQTPKDEAKTRSKLIVQHVTKLLLCFIFLQQQDVVLYNLKLHQMVKLIKHYLMVVHLK